MVGKGLRWLYSGCCLKKSLDLLVKLDCLALPRCFFKIIFAAHAALILNSTGTYSVVTL